MSGYQSAESDIDVLDLPQLYTKPSATTLLATLELLRIKPQTWQHNPLQAALSRQRLERNEEVPAYLTRIISSSLAWIGDEEAKEAIWEAASKRLSERSGRTGMGALDRRFSIPLRKEAIETIERRARALEAFGADEALPDNGILDLSLHEPTLTGDNLGLKTWASSNLLAKRLCCLLEDDGFPAISEDTSILELGSGTGLVGLAAAAVFRRRTILTDLPEIVPNLQRNAEANNEVIGLCGASVDCAVLDWSNPGAFTLPDQERQAAPNTFHLVLAADPIYSPDHPSLLTNGVKHHLSHVDNARLVIELPIREAYGPERQDLRDRLADIGLCVLQEGEEVGVDDWIGRDGELAEVKCWWSVWGWSKHR